MSENGTDTPVFRNQKKSTLAILCLISVLVIGDVDYLTGYKISVLVFYILPLGFATIYIAPAFALFLAILSIAISLGTDFWSGMPRSEIPETVWSAIIALAGYIIAIVLLQALKVSLLRRK